MRIGLGYDIHALEEGRKMVLGGVSFEYGKGLKGHSDGDVLLHAVTDAILGALGAGDIGMRFPDTDPAYKDADSKELLKEVVSEMKSKGYSVVNLDSVVVAEEPKISPLKEEIVLCISSILGVSKDKVNVKGKTSEKLGPVGEGKAIEAQAIVLLDKE